MRRVQMIVEEVRGVYCKQSKCPCVAAVWHVATSHTHPFSCAYLDCCEEEEGVGRSI